MAEVAKQHAEDYVFLDPKEIQPSPTNPRKRLGDLDDLTQSVRTHGVLQPVTVRYVQVDEHGNVEPQLVFGHRRHAAAVKAELARIPCIVRELTDEQVLELQIIENSQREDVHPLDESDGFRALLALGLNQADIADRVGRQVGFVAERIRLGELCEPGRTALENGALTLGAARCVAKLPEELQRKALSEMFNALRTTARVPGDEADTQATTIRADWAQRFIAERVLVSLEEAPFRIDDAELVPDAGACSACPKNTSSQAELFSDASSSDRCTDPVCFRSKLDAAWARMRESSEQRCYDSLEDAPGNHWDYSSVTERIWRLEAQPTVGEFLREQEASLDTILVRADEGRWKAYVLDKDLRPLIEPIEKAERLAKHQVPPDEDETEEERQAREERQAKQDEERRKEHLERRRGEVRRELLDEAVLAQFDEAPPEHSAIVDVFAVAYLVEHEEFMDLPEVLEKCGLAVPENEDGEVGDEEARKVLDAWLADPAMRAERLRVALASALEASRVHHWQTRTDVVQHLAVSTLGIDWKKIKSKAAARVRKEQADG